MVGDALCPVELEMFLGKTCNDNDTAMLALAQASESTSLLPLGPTLTLHP